jgi:hypothetical protein
MVAAHGLLASSIAPLLMLMPVMKKVAFALAALN